MSLPPELSSRDRTDRATTSSLSPSTPPRARRSAAGPSANVRYLVKLIKRVGFGFRNFENYRIRALLYAGRPSWRVLGSIVVR
jgi:transposase